MTPDEIASFMQDVIVQYQQRTVSSRRAEVRETAAIPVFVQPLDDQLQPVGEEFAAVTRDVSVGGLGLFHTRPVPLGLVQIVMEAPDHGQSRKLLGRVEHSTPCGRFFIVGCHIEDAGIAD
jgi:hypothetical protein